MSAGRLAADDEHFGAELLPAVLDQPERRGFAVVGPGRVRMLGGETIVDAHAGDSRVVHNSLEQGILLIRPAEHPSAAVNVEIHAPRPLGRDDPQTDRPALTGNFDTACARRLDGPGKRPLPASARLAHRL